MSAEARCFADGTGPFDKDKNGEFPFFVAKCAELISTALRSMLSTFSAEVAASPLGCVRILFSLLKVCTYSFRILARVHTAQIFLQFSLRRVRIKKKEEKKG